jgi:outer membrane protein assembly factor BamB
VDPPSGETQWESVEFSGSLLNLFDKDWGALARVREWFSVYASNPDRGRQVLFQNSLLGTLSSDGNRVYAIEDLAIPPPGASTNQYNRQGLLDDFGRLTRAARSSRLSAFDLDSGKLVWELGGARDESVLARSYFLGPPLPLAGRLYVVVEQDKELRLACLEAHSGRVSVCWVRRLAPARTTLLDDPLRRLQAVPLAYADGVLVCPTNAGVIVGFDPILQVPLWAYTYREVPPAEAARSSGARSYRVAGMPIQLTPPEWHLSAPVLQEGKVVFTAPDGPTVHCLSLRDGTPLWQTPRRDDLYLAGVYDGKVLLVGKSTCRALRLADGKPLWRVETGPPAGLGVAVGNRYYLPLQNGGHLRGAGISVVALDKGAVVAHSPARPGEPVGNLLFRDGELLVQSATAVAAYPLRSEKLRQADVAVQRAPGNAAARFERGRARFATGNLGGAVEDLVAALAGPLSAEEQVRLQQILYTALTQLLQQDFPEGEKYLKQYRALCEVSVPEGATPVERTRLGDEQQRRQALLQRLLADGWSRQGRLVEAFQAYLDYTALAGARGLASVPEEPGLEMRPELQVCGRIADLLQRTTPEQRRAVNDAIFARWHVLEARGMAALRRMLLLLDPHTRIGSELRLELAERLLRENATTQAELCLLPLPSQADPDLATRIAATQARIAAKVPAPDERRPLPVDGPLRVQERAGEASTRTFLPLDMRGSLPPSLRQRRLVLLRAPPHNECHLALLDADTGAEVWRALLPDPTEHFRSRFTQAPICHVVGHLLILPFLGKLYGFDLLDRKVLWERTATSAVDRVGDVVLASPAVVCVRNPRGVEALDTSTGQTLWERSDRVPNFQAFGAEEHVYLAEMFSVGEPEATQALRMRDGREVRIPDFAALFPYEVRILGRTLLLAEPSTTGERRLRLHDVHTGKDVWQQTFPARSLLLESRDPSQVGLLEPDGILRVFDLHSSKEILHAHLGAQVGAKTGPLLPLPQRGLLIRDQTRSYVILDEGAGPDQSNFAGLASTPVHQATVWAFDSQGKLVWRTAEPVQNQVLLLEQFDELPAFVFSTRLPKAPNKAAPNAPAYLVVTRCLDKATGKEVYGRAESVAGAGSQFHALRIDRAAGTLDLQSEFRTLRFSRGGRKTGPDGERDSGK